MQGSVPSKSLKDLFKRRLTDSKTNHLCRWIGLIFLASGLLASTGVYDTCRGMLEEKTTRLAAIVPMIQDFAAVLSVGLLVVLFLYLARWHMLTRMEHFHE
jgi:hypothetical protein